MTVPRISILYYFEQPNFPQYQCVIKHSMSDVKIK